MKKQILTDFIANPFQNPGRKLKNITKSLFITCFGLCFTACIIGSIAFCVHFINTFWGFILAILIVPIIFGATLFLISFILWLSFLPTYAFGQLVENSEKNSCKESSVTEKCEEKTIHTDATTNESSSKLTIEADEAEKNNDYQEKSKEPTDWKALAMLGIGVGLIILGIVCCYFGS